MACLPGLARAARSPARRCPSLRVERAHDVGTSTRSLVGDSTRFSRATTTTGGCPFTRALPVQRLFPYSRGLLGPKAPTAVVPQNLFSPSEATSGTLGAVIDLHLHSTCSDGSETPERVVELAVAAGCTAMALTDHGRFGGIAERESAPTSSALGSCRAARSPARFARDHARSRLFHRVR